jgi:hypothetical protein
MQQRSKKCAGITCNREVTNMHHKRRKHTVGAKNIFRNDEK